MKRQFRVATIALLGANNVMKKHGDIVSKEDLTGSVEDLVTEGFIEEVKESSSVAKKQAEADQLAQEKADKSAAAAKAEEEAKKQAEADQLAQEKADKEAEAAKAEEEAKKQAEADQLAQEKADKEAEAAKAEEEVENPLKKLKNNIKG